MENASQKITVQVEVRAPIDKVWQYFNEPQHITHWNSASPDWHTPRAENDLRPGGTFSSRMESRDGKEGFDFSGTYDEVSPKERITYTIGDGRKVQVTFTPQGNAVRIVETFEAETQNPIEMQRGGWQSILNNFKQYTESH